MRTSIILKSICFILIPVLFIGIVGSSIVLYELYEIRNGYTYDMAETDLTDISTGNYFNEMINVLQYYQYNKEILKYEKRDSISYTNKEEVEDEIHYYNYRSESNLRYLIIGEDGFQFTNILDFEINKENIIQVMNENDLYYYVKDNNIQTNLDTIFLLKSGYTVTRSDMEGIKEFYTYTDKDSLIGNIIEQQEHYKLERERINEFISIMEPYAIPTLVVSSVFGIIIVIYLFVSLGHKKNYDEIYLNYLDKIPLEILMLIVFIVIGIAAEVFVQIFPTGISLTGYVSYIFEIVLSIICYLVAYIAFAIVGASVLKRIKARTLFKTTLVAGVLRCFFEKIMPFIKRVFESRSIVFKLVIIYGTVCFLSLVFTLSLYEGGAVVGLICFVILAVLAVYVLKKGIEFKNLQLAAEAIYKGKEDIKINEQEFTGEFKKHAEYLDDISGGFSNAIQEGIKSERLKTELITNVSHDIKTPLTSIITYIDLLKKEQIENDKVKEYLEILENKSQRLKKLTEDIVEASKANSGNIRLNMEKINVSELIKQVNAEFEEKFKEKQLDLITKGIEKEKYIYADGKYMSRILENLYSNVAKYALTGSRVYVDIEKNNGKVNIIIKNISNEKLNITTDELMERFVRGDVSRNTEGSGLRAFYCYKFNRNSERKI